MKKRESKTIYRNVREDILSQNIYFRCFVSETIEKNDTFLILWKIFSTFSKRKNYRKIKLGFMSKKFNLPLFLIGSLASYQHWLLTRLEFQLKSRLKILAIFTLKTSDFWNSWLSPLSLRMMDWNRFCICLWHSIYRPKKSLLLKDFSNGELNGSKT